jgi:hypothetical protein
MAPPTPTNVPQRARGGCRASGAPRPLRPVGCMRGLGHTVLGPRNLVREPAAVRVDASWKLASELVKVIDHTREPLLAFEISLSECVRHTLVILLAHSLEVPEVSPARQAMPRKRIDPEAVVLISRLLLGSAERELGTTAIAPEDRVYVPVPGAD